MEVPNTTRFTSACTRVRYLFFGLDWTVVSLTCFYSRYIRVEYYESLNGIRRMKLPDLEGDVLLESNGGLDLSKVRDMWGLENCVVWYSLPHEYYLLLNELQPICPMRWKEVEPEHPDRLSPVAVVVLSEGQDSIKFIGMYMS